MAKRIEFTQEQLDDIHQLYESGWSFAKIQKKYNVTQQVMNRLFRENNWKTRLKYEYRRYNLNESYFDFITTPNQAYIIGLLAADGYNHESTGGIRISLQERDKQILLDINKEIGSDRPLHIRHFDKEEWQDSYTLNINSMKMSARLQELGIVQNKSLILDFPDWIDEDLFPFLLKGYIDGDGWIQKYHLGFMSSDKFCYGVQSFITEHYGIKSFVMDMKRNYSEHTKTWYINKTQDISFLANLMFSKEVLGIERKNNKYIEFGYINKSTTV